MQEGKSVNYLVLKIWGSELRSGDQEGWGLIEMLMRIHWKYSRTPKRTWTNKQVKKYVQAGVGNWLHAPRSWPCGASAEQVAQSWRRKAAEQKHLVWKAGGWVRCLRCLVWRVRKRLCDFADFPCITLPCDRDVDAAEELVLEEADP